ncbi:9340_t:CDS:2 [Gigaspora rosea]|nr:9340_t:CDS:2 [Gigaspora rosea]
MSELGTHEQYVGYSALDDYLRTQTKASYRSFLELNQDVIISSLSAILNGKSLTILGCEISYEKRNAF